MTTIEHQIAQLTRAVKDLASQVQASPQHGCAHWQLQVPARTAPLIIDRPPTAG